MKELLFFGGAFILLASTFSIEIKTNNDFLNQQLGLPGQIPLSDILLSKRKNNPNNFLQVYLAANDKSKYLK